MNVFIILSILIIVIGVLLLVATPSVLFDNPINDIYYINQNTIKHEH